MKRIPMTYGLLFISTSTWAASDEIIPDIGGPYSVGAESTLTLDASASEGKGDCFNDMEYRWDTNGDGTYDTAWSSLPTTIFSAAGYDGATSVTVGLSVQSADPSCEVGAQTQTTIVQVDNRAPAIDSLAVSAATTEGSSEALLLTFSDVESADTHTVAWSFGDGSTATGASTSHAWDDEGSYTVSATVTDDDGGSDSSTATVTVSNIAPTIGTMSAPSTGDEGESLSFSSSATDPGDDTLVSTWDFGDGSTATGASATHVYADNGSYTVTLTVSDGDGGSDTATSVVNVSNTSPVGAFSGSSTGTEGDLLSWALTITDAGTADTHTTTWNFGDGETAIGESASHAYVDDGTYALSVETCDDDGACDGLSTSVVVANAAPQISSATGDLVGSEGASMSFQCLASDPGTADTLSYSWDLGDGSSASGASTSTTYADDGVYTVSCVVSDGSLSVSSSFEVTVSNVSPSINALTAPASGNEGEALSFSVTASDPGDDTLTVSWSFGDGATETGASVTHVYADDGSFVVSVTVSDEDGGTVTSSATVVVSNLAPALSLTGDSAGEEGVEMSFSAGLSDAGSADTFSCIWSYGDGESVVDTTGTVAHTYAEDGSYALLLTCLDDDGASASDTLGVVIANSAPTIDSFTGDTLADEGDSLAFACLATDLGADDTISYSFDFGDGETASGSPAIHAFVDDGVYSVACLASDSDGDTSEQILEVSITNIAPVLSGTPGTATEEGSSYLFSPALSDVGEDDIHTFSGNLPDGVALDSATGEISWNPLWFEVGSHSFELSVSDGDGGEDSMAWSVEVSMLDLDLDGMSDTWEDAYGLDAADSSDSETDADGDGRSNHDEFIAGSDPTHYDGPGIPTAFSPLDGEEVSEAQLTLSVLNAESPMGEALVYHFELYEDVTMSTLVASEDGVVEDDSGVTSWTREDGLEENTWYWWWTAAEDSYTTGDWGDASAFFYNTSNDAPGLPGLDTPFDGSSISETEVDLVLDEAIDPDEDPLVYGFVLIDSDDVEIAFVDGIEGDGLSASYAPEVELMDGSEYCWTAWATDDEGASGEMSELACFLVDTTNDAPSAPVVISPESGSAINTLSTSITIEDGLDPEGRSTVHIFELDTDPMFASDAFQSAVISSDETGSSTWETDELPDNSWVYLRVLCSDGAAYSEWAETSFFVDSENDAPTVPALHNPADGAALVEGDALELVNSVDVDEDTITYDFQVLDLEGSVVEEVFQVEEDASGYTSWTPIELAPGIYTWTARATDEVGLSSEWAELSTFEVLGSGEGDDSSSSNLDADEADLEPSRCSCSTGSASGRTGLGLLSFILALVGMRRRGSSDSC